MRPKHTAAKAWGLWSISCALILREDGAATCRQDIFFCLPQSAFKTRFLFPKGVKKKALRLLKHLKLGIYENLHPDIFPSQSALGREKPRTRERHRRPLQSPLGPQVSVGRTQSEEQMKVGVSNHGFDVRAPPLLDCEPAD